jgi:hypothetical protein
MFSFTDKIIRNRFLCFLVKGFRLGTSLPNPTMLLVFDNQGLDYVDTLVSEDDRSLIHTVNLEEQALLAVFWGAKPS